jgi:flavin-dependent dehydrogenase
VKSDVLVVGGGPAGTSAAITCARAGLSVILLEAEPFPRHRPGETLHPGIEPLMERLGVLPGVRSSGFLRHRGVWVDRHGEREFHSYGSDEHGQWLGYQAPRAVFDSLLLTQAKSIGVRILQPFRAQCALRDGERIVGAKTTAGTINAAFTIDASGVSAWLARQIGLQWRRTSRQLTAFYGYMRGDCPIRDAAPCFFYQSDGWVWTARVRPQVYHWTRLTNTLSAPRPREPPLEFAGLKSVGQPKGADVTWRQLDTAVGPGYFVTGDAATVADPSSSHGVLRAIMSGMLSGHLVLKSLFCDEPGPTLVQQYQQFLQASFTADWSKVIKQPHL